MTHESNAPAVAPLALPPVSLLLLLLPGKGGGAPAPELNPTSEEVNDGLRLRD